MTLTAWLEQALNRGGSLPALTHNDHSLTYKGLEEKSAVIAASLKSTGVKEGDRVVVHLDKSIEAVLAILAILRLGAAYVPFDVRLPDDRKRQLLALIRPALVIDNVKNPSADWAGELQHADVSTLSSQLSAQGFLPFPPGQLSAATPAYLLFTSGSTGLPKAVEISQGAALAFAHWAANATALSNKDSVASVTGFHFDLSTFDLFSSFGSNAHVVLVPLGVTTFPAQLGRLLEKEKITVWYSVPSTISLLAEHGHLESRDLSSLRCLISAGDLFPLRASLKIRERSGCRLFNFYGPTETNVCAAFELPATFSGDETVPIGRGVAGDECLLLREDGGIYASGRGELLVSGPTVMNGYYGDSAANSACFLTHEGKRFYRTGDLVEKVEGANLCFVGRQDGQVKTWGHRVHPIETELALASVPGVAECCVVALPDPRAGFLLHALVKTAQNSSEGSDEIQAALRTKLPSHFLPSSLRIVDDLPHTANGKVDRKAVLGIFEGSRD